MTGRITTYRRDRLVFRVVDTGPLDGEPVVLLHGFPQTADSWRKVTPILNDAGLRTIAPDQRGYSPGASPRGRSAYRMAEIVADAVTLIEAVQHPVHLVGHDWGATVAWATAASHPELVRTLTSVSVPHPRAFLMSMPTSSQALRSWYMAAYQIPLLPEKAMRSRRMVRLGLIRTGLAPADAERIVRDVVDTGAIDFGLNWYRGMVFPPPPEMLRTVTVPTTHIWGEYDSFLTRRGAEITERYVRAPFRLVISDGDHWLPEYRPETVADAILDRVRGHHCTGPTNGPGR